MNDGLLGVKGAVYSPSRAYNAYQAFDFFNEEEIERDFSYARDAGLNALRFFLSYEFYLENAALFFSRFDALLSVSSRHGLRVMPVLFEDCGRTNRKETREDRNPLSAVCIQSPDRSVTDDPSLWGGPLKYLDDFMKRYGSDGRLIAIEVMNEPHEENRNNDFACYMLVNAHERKGSVPLTIGCISLWDNLYFSKYTDILQFHDNFPEDIEAFKRNIMRAEAVQCYTGKPVWLTEWQRLREKGAGWGKEKIADDEKGPALSSLAEAVYSSGLAGSFFWSLMVKPAYLAQQRPNGTYNGLFHEDGSVCSLSDYEAVSGKRNRKEHYGLPLWYLEQLKMEEKNEKE